MIWGVDLRGAENQKEGGWNGWAVSYDDKRFGLGRDSEMTAQNEKIRV